jgi:transposase InsO family protein
MKEYMMGSSDVVKMGWWCGWKYDQGWTGDRRYYNHGRPHQALDYQLPAEVYFGDLTG